jgi:hypothetical protein
MEKKEKLIGKIRQLDDETVLDGILEMVELELHLIGEPVTLTDDQKDFIDEGLRDIEEGKLISNEEVKLKSKEWLKNR